jgi:diguanylate cyclase (GGDEF)-like protein/PAS domain S-box-containing protein
MHALSGSSDILVWCRDVTASVMAEEALRANALHSALVEQTRALLTVFEVDGSLRFVNPAALDLFEHAYHQVNGVASLTDIVHPDDVDTVRERFQEAVAKPRRRVVCNVRLQYGDQWRTLHMEFVNLLEDPAVRGIVADAIDITDELDLAHRALHDPLTGLANRVLLQDRLEHAAANLKREALPVMVGYIDLDRFKVINDTLGHDCGDLVLQEVARRLTASLRPADTVARLGGDEFVVVCPGLPDGAIADELTQRLLLAIAQPIDLGTETRTITASIGVVVLDSALETGAVLQAADAAMYRAKRAGGNFGVRTRR